LALRVVAIGAAATFVSSPAGAMLWLAAGGCFSPAARVASNIAAQMVVKSSLPHGAVAASEDFHCFGLFLHQWRSLLCVWS
jgi:hypothetical protein